MRLTQDTMKYTKVLNTSTSCLRVVDAGKSKHRWIDNSFRPSNCQAVSIDVRLRLDKADRNCSS